MSSLATRSMRQVFHSQSGVQMRACHSLKFCHAILCSTHCCPCMLPCLSDGRSHSHVWNQSSVCLTAATAAAAAEDQERFERETAAYEAENAARREKRAAAKAVRALRSLSASGGKRGRSGKAAVQGAAAEGAVVGCLVKLPRCLVCMQLRRTCLHAWQLSGHVI